MNGCPMTVRGQLIDLVNRLGDDEVRVLARIAIRLLRGAQVYGRLDVVRDERDFQREAREEVEDSLVYLACRWLKQQA